MAGNSFGQAFRITTAGESHGPGNVVIIDGCPPGLALTPEILAVDLARRRPGQSKIVTQRQEADEAEILSGVFEGLTTGTVSPRSFFGVNAVDLNLQSPQVLQYNLTLERELGADVGVRVSFIGSEMSKLLVNRTPFNEAREIALYLTCEIVWHDLRPGHEGHILTNPRRKDGTVPPIGGFQFDPENPPLPPKPDVPRPVQVAANGRAIPEVGESNTTALNMAIERLAVKIVSAMEQPW